MGQYMRMGRLHSCRIIFAPVHFPSYGRVVVKCIVLRFRRFFLKEIISYNPRNIPMFVISLVNLCGLNTLAY